MRMMYQRPHERSPDAVRKPRTFLRLDTSFDPRPLAAELEAAAPWDDRREPWLASQWKWHLRTHFLVLRGGEPTSVPGGRLTSGGGIDAPILAELPGFAEALDTWFPAPAVTAWIGLSPAGSRIHTHIDNTQHWDEHHRIHLPLVTSPLARLCVRGYFMHLPAGTMWAIDNSAPHGAHNDGRDDRLHLMVDLPSTPEVEAWLARGEPRQGVRDPETLTALAQDPFVSLTPRQRANPGLMARLSRQ